MLCHQNSSQGKAIALLYNIANSQSQPKIDLLANFYRHVVNNTNRLSTFSGFVEVVTGQSSRRYEDFFKGLKAKPGWGNKTAALLSKVIFNLHSGDYCGGLKIWEDAPKNLKDDRIHLPVDTVIIEVFKRLGCTNPTFLSINHEIQKYWSGSDVIVWDDLWFWGFITQKGPKGSKVLEWNPNKYWALEHSDKDASVFQKIEEESKTFLSLLA